MAPTPNSRALIVSLDVGSSSVRTLLFDSNGDQKPGFGEQAPYQITTTTDGGVEIDPKLLLDLTIEVLGRIHEQVKAAGLRADAIAFDTFWHSFLGVDKNGTITTPIIHLFDTRSAKEADELSHRLDAKAVHARTGCRLHTSYWPAKLLWLHRNRRDAFEATARWLSFGEFLFLNLFGKPIASTSMVSGSGLWNQAANNYDGEVLAALPIRPDQICPVADLDQPQSTLAAPFREKWPLFDGIPWFPALGDGACNNVGSGCTTAHDFALMVGTSGALRVVLERDTLQIPDGLWCYRVDRKRYVLGGALSNGGDVYAWMHRTLALPPEHDTEEHLRQAKPGSHGLTMLPFFAGERSPYWRSDLHAAITGMNLATTPYDILQAALESVALRFREVFTIMTENLDVAPRIVASGGALLRSPAWTQMMADALGLAVVPCLEREATSRGASLWAAEAIGAIANISGVPARTSQPLPARAENTSIYVDMLAHQKRLFNKLFVEN